MFVLEKEQHQLAVHRGTIQHFVKVRGTRAFYRLAIREENEPAATGKQKPTGQVPEDVLARLDALKDQTATGFLARRQERMNVSGQDSCKRIEQSL